MYEIFTFNFHIPGLTVKEKQFFPYDALIGRTLVWQPQSCAEKCKKLQLCKSFMTKLVHATKSGKLAVVCYFSSLKKTQVKSGEIANIYFI
jgi:hypothetical protein